MADHNILGKKGEVLAIEMLKEKSYEILETNWRYGRDEVDIIARDGRELVVVEVKTRSTDFFGEPEDSVGIVKMRNLINTANEYIEQKQIELECRFDIVSVIINQKGIKIKHIKDAFYSSDL